MKPQLQYDCDAFMNMQNIYKMVFVYIFE